MRRKKIHQTIPLIIVISLFCVFGFVTTGLAQGTPTQTEDVFGLNQYENTGLGVKDPRDTIALIINIALGFLGILLTLRFFEQQARIFQVTHKKTLKESYILICLFCGISIFFLFLFKHFDL